MSTKRVRSCAARCFEPPCNEDIYYQIKKPWNARNSHSDLYHLYAQKSKFHIHPESEKKKRYLLFIAINQRNHHALRIEHEFRQMGNTIKIHVWTRIPDIKSIGESEIGIT